MSQLSSQTRFLLRGSALLIGLLALWWLILTGPMLAVLEGGVDIMAAIVSGSKGGEFMRKSATGDFTFRIPKSITVPASPTNPESQRINSIDFDMSRTGVLFFTLSVPVFGAVVLAAPGWRRNVRPFLIGTGVIALLEPILLMIYVTTSAQKATAQMFSMPLGAFETWAIGVTDYLLTLVAPYAAPFVVAFAVHPELRREILGFGITEHMSPSTTASKGNRSRSRNTKGSGTRR